MTMSQAGVAGAKAREKGVRGPGKRQLSMRPSAGAGDTGREVPAPRSPVLEGACSPLSPNLALGLWGTPVPPAEPYQPTARMQGEEGRPRPQLPQGLELVSVLSDTEPEASGGF